MIFPRPKFQEYDSGIYLLKEAYEEDSLLAFYHRIRKGTQDVTVSVVPFLDPEEYTITVNSSGIAITASYDEGIYRAATSLLQLIRKQGQQLQFAKIEDKPELRRRGYMLDVNSARMPTVDSIKELIDYLSGLKYNELQLYFEGMCFDYSAFAEYTADFDCLTPDDIRELDQYCADRFIDLVPNQNSFGHMAKWLKHEQFRHLGLYEGNMIPGTLNPLLEESYEFVQKLYESVLPHFRSEFVNIGLDEAYGLGRYQIEEYCKEHGKDTVFMEWLNKLNDVATKKYGKKVMFWADMIYNYQSLYHQIPKDAIALEWGYELIQSQMMTEHCISFRDAGIKYYVCPSANTHNTFTGRFDVTSFNIRTAAELATRFGAEGILLTNWGSPDGHPHCQVWDLVPLALCGQYGWNTGVKQDGETFKADFIRNAERYVDETIFGGIPVARLMYRLSNYYLLEPERVHCGTMCGLLFHHPITVSKYAYFFDLKDSGDNFYFDNVISYVRKVMADVAELDFDPVAKAEILLNANMVILASELCKLRIGFPLSPVHKEYLLALIDRIEAEHPVLWDKHNFPKGKEIFLSCLDKHRKALLSIEAV